MAYLPSKLRRNEVVKLTPHGSALTSRERWFVRALFAFLTLLCLGIAGLSIVDTRQFLSNSEHGEGRVVSLHTRDGICGDTDSDYACTRFYAWLEVHSRSKGRIEVLLDSGTAPGHGKSSSLARYRIGDKVPVIFDPDHPATAYEDSMFAVWRTTALFMFFAAGSFYCFLRGRFPFQRPEAD